jgi:hypothetical protein
MDTVVKRKMSSLDQLSAIQPALSYAIDIWYFGTKKVKPLNKFSLLLFSMYPDYN